MNKRKHKKQGRRRNGKQAKAAVVFVPLTLRQEVPCFDITTYEGGDDVLIAGLPATQGTLLDLMQALPKYLRWMHKRKNRCLSVGVSVEAKEEGKLPCCLTLADIDRAEGKVQRGKNFIAPVQKFKNN